MALDFRAKAGPLPIWAWGALIGGAAVAYMWYSGHKAGTAVSSPTTPTTDVSGASSDAIDGAFTAGTASGSGLTDTQAGNLADTGSLFSNNAVWEAQAVAYGAAHGVDPLRLQRAVEDYLNGVTLSSEAAGWLSTIIAAKGIPPEGTLKSPSIAPKPPVPAPVVAPKPPVLVPRKAPPTKAAKPHSLAVYTVKHGDTLSAIAHHYGTTVPKLASANGIHNPNHIAVGQKIRVVR